MRAQIGVYVLQCRTLPSKLMPEILVVIARTEMSSAHSADANVSLTPGRPPQETLPVSSRRNATPVPAASDSKRSSATALRAPHGRAEQARDRRRHGVVTAERIVVAGQQGRPRPTAAYGAAQLRTRASRDTSGPMIGDARRDRARSPSGTAATSPRYSPTPQGGLRNPCVA